MTLGIMNSVFSVMRGISRTVLGVERDFLADDQFFVPIHDIERVLNKFGLILFVPGISSRHSQQLGHIQYSPTRV